MRPGGKWPTALILAAGLAETLVAAPVGTPVPEVAGAAKKTLTLPKNTPFRDEATGVVFPPVIGAFVKTRVRKNSDPLLGTLIRYAGQRPGCSADISIYQLTDQPCDHAAFLKHYGEVRNQILNLPSRSNTVESVEPVRELALPQRRHAGQETERDKLVFRRRAAFQLGLKGENYHSELALLLYRDWIFKVRVTVPAEATASLQDMEQFLRRVCELFDRPQAQPLIFAPADRFQKNHDGSAKEKKRNKK